MQYFTVYSISGPLTPIGPRPGFTYIYIYIYIIYIIADPSLLSAYAWIYVHYAAPSGDPLYAFPLG